MELSKKAFKAYDIRGIVPGEVNAELAYVFLQPCLRRKLPLLGMTSA